MTQHIKHLLLGLMRQMVNFASATYLLLVGLYAVGAIVHLGRHAHCLATHAHTHTRRTDNVENRDKLN